MAFELKITTDISMLPQVVETNIDEVTPIINAAIEKTRGLEVTDNRDEIVAADEDAAKLTKMSKAIARFRIDTVNNWKAPMEVFEGKCKDAEKRLTEAADTIRAKTTEVKDIWRKRKAETCRGILDNAVEEAFPGDEGVRTCQHLETFFDYWTNPKTKGTWLNSTVKESEVEDAIRVELLRMKQTVEALEANYASEPEEVKAKARLALMSRFDMNDVIVAVNNWKAEQARIAEMAKAEAERKAAQKPAPTASPAAPVETVAPTAPASPAPAPAANPATTGKVETYRLEITGTRNALLQMRKYGESLGITFKNLDK